jgi:aspartyl protease family protein
MPAMPKCRQLMGSWQSACRAGSAGGRLSCDPVHVELLPVSQKELPHQLKLLTIWLLVTLVLFLGFKAWENDRQTSRFQLAGETIVLARGSDGHFHWPGRVGDIEVDFLVDTGATATALPQRLAERAGLTPLGAVRTQTANGAASGFVARADITLEGGVRADRLVVTVLPDLAAPLLGMDVLGRLHFTQRPGELRIEPADARP